MEGSADLTKWLAVWHHQDDDAARARSALLEAVYPRLRRLARSHFRAERRDHSLPPTALVHEVYLKLADQTRLSWRNRAQFFATVAHLMRRVLVDHARARTALKRGGLEQGGVRLVSRRDDTATDLSYERPARDASAAADRVLDVLALDCALERLARVDPRQARVVELRFFAGLTVEETADVLGVAAITVKRDWALARAWLYRELQRISE